MAQPYFDFRGKTLQQVIREINASNETLKGQGTYQIEEAFSAINRYGVKPEVREHVINVFENNFIAVISGFAPIARALSAEELRERLLPFQALTLAAMKVYYMRGPQAAPLTQEVGRAAAALSKAEFNDPEVLFKTVLDAYDRAMNPPPRAPLPKKGRKFDL